jgi:omega-6 fatty acid desaturase (delta-12 desaturase)
MRVGLFIDAVLRLTLPASLLMPPDRVRPAITPYSYPSKRDLLKTLPVELTRHDPFKAWGSLALSAGLSAVAYGLGTQIPLAHWAVPLWLLYGVTTGTPRRQESCRCAFDHAGA